MGWRKVRREADESGEEGGLGSSRLPREGAASGRGFAWQGSTMASGFCPTDEGGAAVGPAPALGGCRAAGELAVGGREAAIKGPS